MDARRRRGARLVARTAAVAAAAAAAAVLAALPAPTGAVTPDDPNGNSGYDHRAHAVPGPERVVFDWDGDGAEWVRLDGSQSHSHYFSAGPPVETGRIVRATWYTSGNGAVIANGSVKAVRFRVGSTPILLEVEDNTGSVSSAHSLVAVAPARRSQMRPPRVASVAPTKASPEGNTPAVVKGARFYNQPVVLVDGVPAETVDEVDDSTLRVLLPPHPVGTAQLTVRTKFGESAPVPLAYVKGNSPFAFEQKTLMADPPSRGVFAIERVVATVLGPDQRYYMGTMDGHVHALTVSPDLVVTNECKSPNLGRWRSVMGLAFDPTERPGGLPRLYASTAILFHQRHADALGVERWANGRVERLAVGGAGDAACLRVEQEGFVSGLPVSAHDHSPSGLTFNDNGDLLLLVGSSTNAGVSVPGDGIGGIPDTPLTSAALIAHTSRSGFNGTIRYSNYAEPAKAVITANAEHVQVYAAGIRNALNLLLHSTGSMWAADNSANTGFGVTSLSCGKAGGEPGNEKDRLLRVEQGAYYGTPNRARGAWDPRQCVYHPPTDTVARGGYTPPAALFTSSTNGMAEYTAFRFANRLRGDIFSSKVAFRKSGLLWRTRLSRDGRRVVAPPVVFREASGLSLVVSPRGELVSPQVFQARVLVMVPVERNPRRVRVIGVHPPRGPSVGGNTLAVVGWNFVPGDTRAFVGGTPCTAVFDVTADSLKCRVPPGKGRVRVTVRVGNASSEADPYFNYRYVATRAA